MSEAASAPDPERPAPGKPASPESQRRRLVDAMEQLCFDQGYANVKIGDLATLARVAKRTFYVHFVEKEDCFLAAYERADAAVFTAIAQAAATQDAPLARIEQGIAALLRLLATQPALAQVFVLESQAVGPRATARRIQTLHRFADLYIALHEVIRERYAPPIPMSRVRAFAVVGAIELPIATVLREDGAAALPALGPEISRAVFTLVHSPQPLGS